MYVTVYYCALHIVIVFYSRLSKVCYYISGCYYALFVTYY